MVVPLPLPCWCSDQLLSASLEMVVVEWVLACTPDEVGKQTIVGSKVMQGNSDAGCTGSPKMMLRPRHDVRR